MKESQRFILKSLLLIVCLVIAFHIGHFAWLNHKVMDVLAIEWNVKPIIEQPDLLTKRLDEVAVNSSHNTYLDYTQHINFTTFNTLEKCLKYFNVRSIELDIGHAIIDGKDVPAVYHGYKTFRSTSPRPLSEALSIIKEHGFHTSDPLFIFTDVYDSPNLEMNQRINDLFIEYLGDKIYKSEVEEPPYLKDIIGKVLIYGPPVCAVFEPQYQRIVNQEYAADHEPEKNKIYRVYRKGSLQSYLSNNFEFDELIKKGYQMIAMNNQTNDDLMVRYYNMFKNSSFISLK